MPGSQSLIESQVWASQQHLTPAQLLKPLPPPISPERLGRAGISKFITNLVSQANGHSCDGFVVLWNFHILRNLIALILTIPVSPQKSMANAICHLLSTDLNAALSGYRIGL